MTSFPYFTLARELHAPYGLVLAYVGKNTISRIICKARKRGDPHAKIHTYRNGRPAGRPGRKWEQEK